MLRITQSVTRPVTTIQLEGKLLAPWVEELDRVVTAAASHGAVRVNLAALSFADAAGIECLRALSSRGIELFAGSDFLTKLIKSAAS
jgi:anti-anti-sigma regulatory factor